MCVMVMECTNAIEGNVLSSEQKLPYSCLWCIDQTEFAIQLSVPYRPNKSCHTAVCAVQTKQKMPYSSLCSRDQTEVAIHLSVLYRPNRICHTAVCAL